MGSRRSTAARALLCAVAMLVAGVLHDRAAGPALAQSGPCPPQAELPTCPPPPQQPPSPQQPPQQPPPATGPPSPSGGSTPPPPAPAEPEPCALERHRGSSDFFGLVSEDVFAGGRNYRRCALSTQAGAGVGLARQVFYWSQIERTRSHYDLSAYDEYMAATARHGIQVLPILFDPPRFRSAAPRRGARRGTYPPRRHRDLGRFAAVLVRRYGRGGSFWRAHPELPALPVRAWQIWNEPNLPVYWPSGPDPAEYVRLLQVTAEAIRRVDPAAEIVSAGLPDSRLGTPLLEYVAGMYAAGAITALDSLAIHPYAPSPEGVMATLAAVRRLMDASGDPSGSIWVTEFGWSDLGPHSFFRAGPMGQARRIRSTVRALAHQRRALGIRGLVYYNNRDQAPYSGREFWGLHTGLLRRDGSPKLAFYALKNTIAKLR